MRAITKGPEPRSLTEHRSAANADYGNFQAKDELRTALVGEQRGLCCYCMGRVKDDSSKMKIEHWRCQEYYHALQLTYSNLLAACKGGEGRPKTHQHCDTRKAHSDIRWNPADPVHAIEFRIQYSMDGSVGSADDEFDKQLNETLNLNTPLLKAQRKSALDGLLDWYRKLKKQRQVSNAQLRQQLKRLTGEGESGWLEPFSPVPAWWVRQKLAG